MINASKTSATAVPDEWKDAISEPTVVVLPLVRDIAGQHSPGWCTYTYEHAQAPELEVLCGGINHKTPEAGAIWRQGNLLHFGFDLSPAEMNDTGQALLVNAIAYIARFTEDRPIVHTPCVFVQGKRLFDRDLIARRLKNPQADLSSLSYYLGPETWRTLQMKSRPEVQAWYERSRSYLHADAEGKLVVDPDAQRFGIGPASLVFLEKAVAERTKLARQLLSRYVPEGPGTDAALSEWQAWLTENKSYLFFADTGGYRWHIDPLAKKRKVPSKELRGPARATLPVVARAAPRAR
jgi:GNAT superfamily N-acetyltransferase